MLQIFSLKDHMLNQLSGRIMTDLPILVVDVAWGDI